MDYVRVRQEEDSSFFLYFYYYFIFDFFGRWIVRHWQQVNVKEEIFIQFKCIFSFFPSNLFSLLSAVVILKFWLFQEEWKKYEEFMSLIIMNIIYPFSCRFLRLYNHIRLWPYVCSFGRRLTTHRHTHSNTESDERCDTRILYKCARETFHTRITRRRHQIRAYIIYMILCSI